MGLVTALVVYISENEEHPMTLFFASVVVLWAIGKRPTGDGALVFRLRPEGG